MEVVVASLMFYTSVPWNYYNQSMSIEGEVLSLQQAEQNVIDTKELATLGSVFLFHKKVLSYVIKMLRGDRSATERKMALHDLPQEEKPAGEIPFLLWERSQEYRHFDIIH